MTPELGTFSLDVSKRILDKLCDVELNRTNLASSSRINYNTLLRYLSILSALGWIRMTELGMVAITPFGQEVRKRLHNLGSNESSKDESYDTSLMEFVSKHALLVDGSAKMQNLAPTSDSKIKESTTNNVAMQSHIRKVMIVDDESDVGLTYKMILKSTGRYKVDAFADPDLALKVFASDPEYYDMAILDIRMPRINGLKLYQRMSSMSPDCRFLFISALDAAGELLSIFPTIEQQDIIRKPISKNGFIKAVDSHFAVS